MSARCNITLTLTDIWVALPCPPIADSSRLIEKIRSPSFWAYYFDVLQVLQESEQQPAPLIEERGAALAAVRQNGLALQYVRKKPKSESYVTEGRSTRYVPQDLRKNLEVLQAALSQNGAASKFVLEEVRRDTRFQAFLVAHFPLLERASAM